MRYTGLALATVALAALSGCSSDASAPKAAERTSAATTPAPAPEKTYVPAPGDPTTHTFDVTIHDVLPLDAYEVAGGKCSADSVAPEFPSTLTFSGPSKHLDEVPLDEEFPIPKTARLLADGSCEATMSVTVPYRPRYRAGVAIEGRGIANPDDPINDLVNTEDDSQAITVFR